MTVSVCALVALSRDFSSNPAAAPCTTARRAALSSPLSSRELDALARSLRYWAFSRVCARVDVLGSRHLADATATGKMYLISVTVVSAARGGLSTAATHSDDARRGYASAPNLAATGRIRLRRECVVDRQGCRGNALVGGRTASMSRAAASGWVGGREDMVVRRRRARNASSRLCDACRMTSAG